jgi:hypothetical protein
VNPDGYAYGDTNCAQYVESGGALRKPALGGAFLSMAVFEWMKL